MRFVLIIVLTLAATAAGAQGDPSTSAAATVPRAPSVGVAPSLADLVALAWQRSRVADIRNARAAEIDARDAATRAAFPDAPSIGFDLRRDLPPAVRLPGTEPVAERGRNELEPGVSMLLWLPGQRDGQRQVVARDRDRLAAHVRLERLRVAGEVREAVWAAALAQSDLQLQQGRHAAARALEADVDRRVGAGELAPVDRMLARTEVLAAASALRDAQARHELALVELHRLAGVDATGEIAEPAVGAPLSDDHPVLAALR